MGLRSALTQATEIHEVGEQSPELIFLEDEVRVEVYVEGCDDLHHSS